MAAILYGTGLRLIEALRLRRQDVDFARNLIYVREPKGSRWQVTMLPAAIRTDLEQHLRRLHRQQQLAKPVVHVPNAIVRKYPSAPTSWQWSWIFPASKDSV